MSRTPLTVEELPAALASLPGWEVQDGKLHKRFKFKDFVTAMGWMVSVALEAEKLDHHPDWCNSWNKVEVDLRTHSADAITDLDVALARKMNALAGE
jgi:4a-hydroxytetrahydrobiopterin dehydratase